jgi:hypothetical protein
MNDNEILRFTCKECGGHDLIVTHVWSILAGLESESWQEWGLLKANHLWRFNFKEKIEEDEEDDGERGDYGEFIEDDSDSEPQEYEIIEQESDSEGDEFYVNCAGCDREIEFGWSQPNRGGRIYPVEWADFIPEKSWPEPRYLDSWQQKHWLRMEAVQPWPMTGWIRG